MTHPRVAITGIGVVSAFGAGREAFWDAIRCGRSGTRAISEFDASTYPCKVAAPVPPLDMSSAMAVEGELGPRETRADPKRYSRAALFGVLAAREAWNDAGLTFAEPNAGVIIGSGGGGIDVGEQQYRDFFQNNGHHVSPKGCRRVPRGDRNLGGRLVAAQDIQLVTAAAGDGQQLGILCPEQVAGPAGQPALEADRVTAH